MEETKLAQDLDNLKEEIGVGQKIESVNILFLDISSTCTGYCIANINFQSKKVDFIKSGAIWLDKSDWNRQDKYVYMFNAILNYFWIIEGADYIVVEEYMLNKRKLHGVQVVIEMHGAIKTAAGENGVSVDSILPQTWRAQLGIKAVKDAKGKRDFKQPTKEKVAEYLTVPERIVSNITNKERNTPTDIYDAVAIAMGWCKKFGLNKWNFSKMEYNTHLGALESPERKNMRS